MGFFKKSKNEKKDIKDYYIGEEKIQNLVNADINITKDNIKDIFFFETNRDLSFRDGSFIEKGTSFVIDGIKDDVVELHFEEVNKDSKNVYKRNDGIGDNYSFKVDEILEFSNPSKEGIERYGNINMMEYDKENLLEILNNDISKSQKDFIEANYENYEKFIDVYIEDMEKYKSYELNVNKQSADIIDIKEYINHEIDVHNENQKEFQELPYTNEYKSIYEYPDSEVLKNKLNIKDPELLEKMERGITAQKLLELQEKPISGNFDYQHLSKIHKYIFKDIYDWAGTTRAEEIGKGNTNFAPSHYVVEGLKDQVFTPLRKEKYCKGLNAEELSKRLSYYYCELNFGHPFREGNGRTQREFIRELAAKNGFDLDWSKVDSKNFLDKTIQATMGVGKVAEKALGELADIIKGCFTSLEPDKGLIKKMDKIYDLDRGGR